MGCSKRPVCLPPHQQAFLFGPNHLGPTQPCAFIMHQHLDSSYLWSMLNTNYYRVCITFDGNNQVALEVLNLHSISGPFASEFFLHTVIEKKHRKNCECCHHHSIFKGHNVIVHIVVLNCQKCNQCLKCHVSGHKNFQKL